MRRLLPILSLIILGACSGGGGQSAPAVVPAVTITPSPVPSSSPLPGATATPSPVPTIAATATPTPIPTAIPTVAPTATPTPVPTAIPLSLKSIKGAPLSATVSQLSNVRRTQSQGTNNGIPILVESSGAFTLWAGDFVNWVSNAQDGKDVAETSGTITATNNLTLNNPGFAPLSCLGSNSAACIVHPMGWEFGTAQSGTKPVGKQMVSIAFGDGVMGTTFDYVYDGWSLTCNTGWAYQGGVPVPQATVATSDVYLDCVNSVLKFTQGGVLMANPSQDVYGRYETAFPSTTAAFIQNSLFVNAPFASITQGQIFGIGTHDGGNAKVYINSGVSTILTGMALHAQSDFSYAF